MLIGMDVLGLLDTLVIDYRRKDPGQAAPALSGDRRSVRKSAAVLPLFAAAR